MGVLKLKSAFKDYIWGGNRLREQYHKISPLDRLAESWELSCHPQGMSVIENGEHAGKTLREYIDIQGGSVLGKNCRRFQEFPILIKFIDAAEDLSIQVHPDNRFALKEEGEYGKTEMWYIMDCKDGAYLYYGFSRHIEKDELKERIASNTLTEVLNKIYVQKGDVVFVQAGTVHAIGKDIMLAEIQQNSNVTYRLYDYGRRDREGHMRDLHIEKALKVMDRDPVMRPRSSCPHLASCNNFIVDKLSLDGELFDKIEGNVGEGSFLHLLVLEGKGNIRCGEDKIIFQKGDSFFLPAGSGKYKLLGECEILATTIGEKKDSVRVGVDVGGTGTKIGIVNDRQEIIDSATILTRVERPWQEVIKDIADGVLNILEKNGIQLEDCQGVGAGVPGTVDKRAGVIKYANNLNWEEIPFAKEMNKHLKIPVYVANDADCAALGEVKRGAARQCSDVVMLTLGTGVGGGVVLNGTLFEGSQAGGCELGHMVVEMDGTPCTCGRNGCLEACASATAIVKNARRKMEMKRESVLWRLCGGDTEKLVVAHPFIAAEQGDETAVEIVNDFVKYLSAGIINIVNIFRPEKVILGGGVADGGFVPLDRIIDNVKRENYGADYNSMPEIVIAELGNRAGIIGAANLV